MSSQDTITLTGSATGDTPVGEVTIPRELGPVRLLREIGRGGMGVVYLGRHQMLDRDVAVKFLPNAVAGADDPGFARFLEGARAAARLEHPGLTTIHHADMVDGIPYLVMQYIDGPALSDVLKQTGPLSLSALFAVLDAVSEAIGELHDRGIIHRDIKPSNVLLSHDGRVVVTDFGLALARPMGQRGPSSAGLAGTPVYMAPEMFTGEVSLRSDVYALGIMTFELLTGELPFTGTLEEVRQKHLHEPMRLEPLQRRRLDPAMIEVLQRATHKNAMFRYKSAQHFRSALKPGIMTDELLREGVADLQRLVSQAFDGGPHATTTEAAETTPTSTYFDRLSEIADEKRTTRELSDKESTYKSAQGDREAAPPLSPNDEPVAPGAIRAGRPTPATARVANIPCIHCGYNLRGLPEGGRCPECGTAIARSSRGNLLSAADPAWLKRVDRGQALIAMGGLWVGLVGLLNGDLFGLGPAAFIQPSLFLGPNTFQSVFNGVISAAGILLLLLGAFTVTTLDPRLSLTEQPIVLRRFVRWSITALMVLVVCTYLAPRALKELGVDTELASLCGSAFRYVSAAVFLCGMLSICYYLAGLAMRIPDAGLASRIRSRVIGFVVCLVICPVGTQVLVYGERAFAGTPGVAVILMVIMIVGQGLLMLLMAAYLFLLIFIMSYYQKAFKKCLLEARKHAAAQDGHI